MNVSETDAACMIIDYVKHPLSYVDVAVALPDITNVSVRAKCPNDSGSECALICQSVLKHLEQVDPIIPVGEVQIKGICGYSVV